MSATTDTRPGLTAQHRCDRCGAQAFIRANMPSGIELLFCGHHGAKHREALEQQAISVDDYRHMINGKSESSA